MNNKLFSVPPQVENLSILFRNSFSIPVFQRPYSWGNEEINELFNDITDYYYNKPDEELFIGTVYLSLNRQIKTSIFDYSIIDGQQRITTLSLTLLVLYYYAVKYNLESDRAVSTLKGNLWKETNGRDSNKEEPLLTSSGIEQKVMKYIFDCFFEYSKSNKVFEEIDSYKCENRLETKIISNLKTIYKNITNKVINKSGIENKEENLLKFIDFTNDNLKFITICIDKNNIKKLFEIFESINSKGKQLDQIDLIKSYIFQNIAEKDYDTYLTKWGELIKKTEDNLEDYMYVFLKAYIKYYRVGISAKYFRTLDYTLMKYYKVNDLGEALKKFMDDLSQKVENYNIMNNKSSYLINSSKFKYYTDCLKLLEYEHPSPLIFRTYCEYKYNDLDKKDLTNIIKTCFSYMFSFQTLSNRDSKDSINAFETIMNNIFENGYDVNSIISEFKNNLIINGINTEIIETNINNYIGYSASGERTASRILLSAYEFSNDAGKIDYDKAGYIINNKDSINIDHILPQNPEKDDKNCFYYSVTIKGKKILKLKENNDFKRPGIYDGMDYEIFLNQILNKIGNLKLMWKLDNINKSNNIVTLKDYSTFNTYNKIAKRSKRISSSLINNEMFKI